MESHQRKGISVAPNTHVPVVDGWFTIDAEPHLIGSRCRDCGTYFFPKETVFCRNPSCSGTELEDVPLSRRGTLWSYAVNHFPPPPPAVSPEPFVPYGVAAVELPAERMIVLGQIAGPLEGLGIGDDMEIVVESDASGAPVWKWRKA